MGPSTVKIHVRVAAVSLVASLPLLALLAGPSALPLLLLPAIMLLPALVIRGRTRPPEPPAEGGGGGGDGGSPLIPPAPIGSGGIPLPDAEQSANRLRGSGRADWSSARRRGAVHAPGGVPDTPRVAPRR